MSFLFLVHRKRCINYWLNFTFSIDWISFSFLQGWLYFWIFLVSMRKVTKIKTVLDVHVHELYFRFQREASLKNEWWSFSVSFLQELTFFCFCTKTSSMNVILYSLVCEKIKLPNLYPKLTWNLHQVLISIIVVEFYTLVKFQLYCIWFYNGRHHTSHFSQLHFEWLVPYHELVWITREYIMISDLQNTYHILKNNFTTYTHFSQLHCEWLVP